MISRPGSTTSMPWNWVKIGWKKKPQSSRLCLKISTRKLFLNVWRISWKLKKQFCPRPHCWFSHFTFLSWLLFMWRLRKALVLVTKLHTLHLNSVLCFLSTCESISFPCFPVKSHREHFTLGLIMASGPFGLVFLGLGFVWRGGRLIPWSCRSTGAGAGGVMPRAKSRGVAGSLPGSGTPISSLFPPSFFLIRASKSIFDRKYFQLILNMRGDRYQNVSVPKRKMRKDWQEVQ